MTLREIFESELPFWWCKFSFTITDYCKENFMCGIDFEKNQPKSCNWLDMTLWEVGFSILVIYIIWIAYRFLLFGLEYLVDAKWKK